MSSPKPSARKPDAPRSGVSKSSRFAGIGNLTGDRGTTAEETPPLPGTPPPPLEIPSAEIRVFKRAPRGVTKGSRKAKMV